MQLRAPFDRRDVADALATLEGLYDAAILRRAEAVLLERMRKYPVFFV